MLHSRWLITGILAGALPACAAQDSGPEVGAESEALSATMLVAQPVLTASALKDTVLIKSKLTLPQACPPPAGTRPDPTLVNTDSFVLSRFPLQRVYQQLLSTSGDTAPGATPLYQQLWDSLDTSANAKFSGVAHCDDNGSTINGFPIDCPRPETQLKNTDPSKFTPVALFNRFDLSPSDGSTCGEYRIIYAMNASASSSNPYGGGTVPTPVPLPRPVPLPDPGPVAVQRMTTLSAALSPAAAVNSALLASSIDLNAIKINPLPPTVQGRAFIIFEGALPNPNPSCGIEACRPVVNFWENLASLDPTTSSGQTALADNLEQLYFTGISGFQPVVHANHYGQTGGAGYNHSGGQIRVNMFVDSRLWQLREFHLTNDCIGGTCRLKLEPVTVKTNPFSEMFDADNPSSSPKAPAFRSAFPAQTQTLANDVITRISMNIDDTYNAGQSTSQSSADNYELQFNTASTPNAFSAAIDSQLLSPSVMRPDLTAADIVRRATTQSCAGCHQLSNGAHLGGTNDPVWPSSLGFVQVDEKSTLSPALWCSFLPARKSTLDGFSSSSPRTCPAPTRVFTAAQPLVVVDPEITAAQLPQVAPAALTVSGRVLGPN